MLNQTDTLLIGINYHSEQKLNINITTASRLKQQLLKIGVQMCVSVYVCVRERESEKNELIQDGIYARMHLPVLGQIHIYVFNDGIHHHFQQQIFS